MLAVMSMTSFAGGPIAACFAERVPAAQRHIELAGGVLLVLGLVLVGAGLPLFR